MAKLHGLIKFKRHELDEKRRYLADLNTELEHLRALKQQLLDDLAREKNLAAVDINAARNFTAYLTMMKARAEALDDAIRDKAQEVQAATLVVQDAFLDAKKVEITQENRDAAEKDRLDKKEDDAMDEMGLQSFRRGQDRED